MPTRIPIGLIAAAALAAHCLGDPGDPAPSSDWRSALAADFPYQATPPAVPAAKAARPPSESAPADPGVVPLPAFVVRDDSARLLGNAAAMQDAPKPPRTVAQKLGIGGHEIKLKHVTLRCTTILFVPILVGIDW